jgi:hypothetical protein
VILSRGRAVLDAPLAEALVAGEVVFEAAIDDERARALAREAWTTVGLAGAPELELSHTKGIARVRIALPTSDAARLDELCAAIGQVSLGYRVPLVGLVPGRTRLEERFAAVTGGRADDA